jgi:hypothetical protein
MYQHKRVDSYESTLVRRPHEVDTKSRRTDTVDSKSTQSRLTRVTRDRRHYSMQRAAAVRPTCNNKVPRILYFNIARCSLIRVVQHVLGTLRGDSMGSLTTGDPSTRRATCLVRLVMNSRNGCKLLSQYQTAHEHSSINLFMINHNLSLCRWTLQ